MGGGGGVGVGGGGGGLRYTQTGVLNQSPSFFMCNLVGLTY